MKHTKQQKKDVNSFTKRIQSYLVRNEKVLEGYNLSMQLVVNFPKRRKVPMLCKLALWIIRKKGGLLDIRFTDLEKK